MYVPISGPSHACHAAGYSEYLSIFGYLANHIFVRLVVYKIHSARKCDVVFVLHPSINR
jgi:hypothetical protein